MENISLSGHTLAIVWLINFSLLTVRYLLFAGTAYSIFWIWKRDKLQYKRTQIEYPEKSKLIHEFKYSMITMTIFAAVGVGIFIAKKNGLTFLYNNISERGVGYFIFSIIAAILIHDTFFYWSHRLMHHKSIFKYMHKVHHNSTNPSPWAAFSFHPSESIVEAMIVPILVIIMPIHPLAILAFLLYMTFMNVLGHLGFELYPKGFTTHWLGKWNNTATHHNMHHRYFNCNYGLYFNFWDRMMGTNHPNYHEVFEEVTSRKPVIGG
jgi:sterol desaturase/sphingolipid hydroxylase (fatty acid hydroxylase superfamily)